MTSAHKSSFEFIVRVALLNAMVAMSIDTMLPALGVIASELGALHANDRQLIITLFFGGMTLGTLVSGPVSDSTGRKAAIFASLLLYAVGAAMCVLATGFTMMLLGRFIQGFGAAGPRIVSIAMVRDGSAGAAMALRLAKLSWVCATALDAAISVVARRRARAIMTNPQRNMLEVDCSIWSAALTILAFIS